MGALIPQPEFVDPFQSYPFDQGSNSPKAGGVFEVTMLLKKETKEFTD
jgi:hypothetical protein